MVWNQKHFPSNVALREHHGLVLKLVRFSLRPYSYKLILVYELLGSVVLYTHGIVILTYTSCADRYSILCSTDCRKKSYLHSVHQKKWSSQYYVQTNVHGSIRTLIMFKKNVRCHIVQESMCLLHLRLWQWQQWCMSKRITNYDMDQFWIIACVTSNVKYSTPDTWSCLYWMLVLNWFYRRRSHCFRWIRGFLVLSLFVFQSIHL